MQVNCVQPVFRAAAAASRENISRVRSSAGRIFARRGERRRKKIPADPAIDRDLMLRSRLVVCCLSLCVSSFGKTGLLSGSLILVDISFGSCSVECDLSIFKSYRYF